MYRYCILITQDHVNKLSSCESKYPERIDDMRDEMITKIDMGTSVVGRASFVFLWGASVISCNRTTNGQLHFTIIKTMFCDSHFSTITECC